MSKKPEAETDTDYRVIQTTAIPEVAEVRFYEETMEHIVGGHAEFRSGIPSLEHAVADTVANPTAVYRSRTLPETSVVFESSNNTLEGNPCTVPVRIVSGTSGRVTTAMFKRGNHGPVL